MRCLCVHLSSAPLLVRVRVAGGAAEAPPAGQRLARSARSVLQRPRGHQRSSVADVCWTRMREGVTCACPPATLHPQSTRVCVDRGKAAYAARNWCRAVLSLMRSVTICMVPWLHLATPVLYYACILPTALLCVLCVGAYGGLNTQLAAQCVALVRNVRAAPLKALLTRNGTTIMT